MLSGDSVRPEELRENIETFTSSFAPFSIHCMLTCLLPFIIRCAKGEVYETSFVCVRENDIIENIRSSVFDRQAMRFYNTRNWTYVLVSLL